MAGASDATVGVVVVASFASLSELFSSSSLSKSRWQTSFGRPGAVSFTTAITRINKQASRLGKRSFFKMIFFQFNTFLPLSLSLFLLSLALFYVDVIITYVRNV